MALIKSISGFRGTIGGAAGSNLTPEDIVQSTAAFAAWLLQQGATPKVVIGRDARPSGTVVSQLAAATLQAMGIDVIDLGLSTTPTVEVAVPRFGAGGGIVLSASHNPVEWNALKLLNSKGEFISAADGQLLLQMAEAGDVRYVPVQELGAYSHATDGIDYHVQLILQHPLVDVDAIRQRRFKVVVDAVNSTGGMALQPLLEALGCTVTLLNGEPDGQFAHNPEPLPQHLNELLIAVADSGADIGLATDPDVDRLALVGPGGTWIGEEYTLVTVADYVLARQSGPVVSNLSSTRALRDLAAQYGQDYHAAAVGEVNVVTTMKAVGAVMGGEGNGGIIDPHLHYGRDALVGTALVLSHLALSGKDINALRASYPDYHMVKDKVNLSPDLDVEACLANVQTAYQNKASISTIDGVKIDLPEGWIHLRRSNTEPIVRIYTEAGSAQAAQALADEVKQFFS